VFFNFFACLFFFTVLFQLMPDVLMLTQLIRYVGNLVDLWRLSNRSCRANFTSNNEDDNNNDVIYPLHNSEELVVVNVIMAEPIDIKGVKGAPFLMDAEQK
jgi:hypothetical protein